MGGTSTDVSRHAGGEWGKGKDIRVLPDGLKAELPGATAYAAGAGVELIIETPGAGGGGNLARAHSSRSMWLFSARSVSSRSR